MRCSGTDNWCGILILHLNVKMCHAQPAGLDMALGRKYDQPVDDAYKLHFDYKARRPTAPTTCAPSSRSGDGPLGTKDYRIAVEAAPLDAAPHDAAHELRLRLRLHRARGDERLPVDGRQRQGRLQHRRQGQPTASPTYVGGVRGLVERNTMRYYLAIDDYVAAPAPAQLEQRLNTWFDATERYPRQLHEVEKSDYLAMKRDEAKR